MTSAVFVPVGDEQKEVIRLSAGDLGRPIRVVVFGGAFFEPAALELLARLDTHPEVELVGGFCQSPGLGLRHAIGDVMRRRTWLAPLVLAVYAIQWVRRFATDPTTYLKLRRRVRPVLSRIETVPQIHAPMVLDRVRALAPDLGLVYGAPVLRPELFQIPVFGTLGIHHGKLPDYRGKKLTFWAMLNGDSTTGVTIQRLDRGIDTGDLVCAGEVAIGNRRYARVEADVQDLGIRLYLNAILAVKRGEALCRPQTSSHSRIYRQPSARDIVRLWYRYLVLRRRPISPLSNRPTPGELHDR